MVLLFMGSIARPLRPPGAAPRRASPSIILGLSCGRKVSLPRSPNPFRSGGCPRGQHLMDTQRSRITGPVRLLVPLLEFNLSGRETQGEGFSGVSIGIGEPGVLVAACFSRANMSLPVESTRVESLLKIL